MGLEKNQTELFLAYLQKVGVASATEIQKDVRSWAGTEGECARRVATWGQAHKVLVEGDRSRRTCIANPRELQPEAAMAERLSG